MQLRSSLRRSGSTARVRYLVEVLDEAYGGPRTKPAVDGGSANAVAGGRQRKRSVSNVRRMAGSASMPRDLERVRATAWRWSGSWLRSDQP